MIHYFGVLEYVAFEIKKKNYYSRSEKKNQKQKTEIF